MTTTLARRAPTRSTRRGADDLAGLAPMVRLVVRRNRVRLVVWLVVLVALVAYVASYYRELFSTQQALDEFAAVSDTPGIRALTGLSPAADTLGGAVWTKSWMTLALSLALGVVFLVTRNGRADEEAGRTELLRSRALGVHAHAAASWVVLAALCLAVGAGVAAVSVSQGLDPQGAGITGSLVLGASVTGVGLFALGVAAVSGQVAATARGANTLAACVVLGCYVLRMIGDLGDGTLTWASPIGWAQEAQPFAGNRWWPLVLLVVVSVGLCAVAVAVEGARDHGTGLLAARPGPASAPARFGSPLGLGLRLQRGPVVGWSLAVVLTALLFGSVVDAMTDLMDDVGGDATAILGGTGVSALLALLASMIALVTAVFAIQSALTLRADEATGILEPQLAGALSRTRWALERLVIPVVGSAVLLVVGGATLGAVHGSTVDDPAQAAVMAGAALAYWPAVMVLVGLAVALLGWAPRLALPVTWGVLVAMWIATMLGEVLGLPDWLLDALPFAAVPYLPLEELAWAPLAVLTAVAVGLASTGLRRFARRDVEPA